MVGVLYHCQNSFNKPVFIGAVGWKCTKYDDSGRVLAAMNFAFEKYKHLLLQGPFLVQTDNCPVENAFTVKHE